MGDRAVQPRLSGQWNWVHCPGPVCGPAPPPQATCDVAIRDRETALRQLGTACTDAAVDFLVAERPQVPEDVAAAWYVSAQQHGRPRDLFRAYDAALAAPPSAGAWFNRSLIEEALGLPPSWDRVPLDELDTRWAEEVRERRARMSRVDAAAQWDAVHAHLPAALRSGNAAAVAERIAPFPGAALKYLEEELPLDQPASAQTLAEALFLRTKDPYARHIARAWQQSVSGMAEFRAARAWANKYASPAQLYRQAATLLARAGNPLHLDAAMRHALEERDPRTLVDYEREAERRGYQSLLGRIRSSRAFFVSHASGFPEALALYERSAAAYLSARDHDRGAGSLGRKAGVARAAGHSAGALQDILRALQYGRDIITPKELQNVYGEAGKLALHLGHPELALAFQNVVIDFYERAIGRTNPARVDLLTGLRTENRIAFVHRAGIHAALDQRRRAIEDLQTARIAGEPADPQIASLIAMRQDEMEAQALLRIDGIRAATFLTRALEAAGPFHTYRASLYMQRAEAYRNANRLNEADADLRRAIQEINAEEEELLRRRKAGESEELWPGYFARFQDAYHRLIQSLIEHGAPEEAFHYAERARAYETLDLLMSRTSRPERIRSLGEIQKTLPPATAVFEYSVHADRMYVWTITRQHAHVDVIPVPREELERWSERLREAGNDRDLRRFDELLARPPASLLPRRSPAAERLVIVADAPLHGIPFAALRNPATGNLLVRDFVLETAPSAALYAAAVERNAALGPLRNPSVLAVGNPRFERTLPIAAGLANLTHAGQEAEYIAALYAPNARTLLDAEATVEAFFRHAEGKDILHFAGHGIVNPPALLLAPYTRHNGTRHDGALHADELLTGLPLARTRLVVLSACSTAGGLPIGAEGVAPLVRPIITAGVPAVVGSLWNVHDATAKALLVSFHTSYRESGDAAAALQAAQLEFLDSGKAGSTSAALWGSFQVIGHNAPTDDNDKGEPP